MTPVVVRASVRANLLGIHLLRLEADIAIAPVTSEPADRPGRAAPVTTGTLTEAAQLLARATRTLDATPAHGGAQTWDAT